MCLRFLNWPIQRLQRGRLNERCERLAVHTAVEPKPLQAAPSRKERTAQDLRFVRSLFPAAKSAPVVVAVSSQAWQAGIRPGMSLAEARSMAAPVSVAGRTGSVAAETEFRDWLPATDREELRAVAELTRSFAPIIGIDESPVVDSLLLDVTGCGQLFGGESSLAEQLIRRLHRENFQVQAAISDSVAAAWAFAHPRGHFLRSEQRRQQRRGKDLADTPVFVVPPGQSETWLAELPLAAARLPVGDTDVLFQLGILTIRQLLGLPMDDLPARLSAEASQRIRQLRGLDEELITAIPEANPIRADWSSEFAATDFNQIQQILSQLTQQISEQLIRRQVGAVRLDCDLVSEAGGTVSMQVELVKPVQEQADLNDVVRLRLDQHESSGGKTSIRGALSEKPVTAVSVAAVTAPLPVARQRDLFSATEHIRPTEELAQLMNRLSNRLGKDSVLTVHPAADPVPEKTVRLQSIMSAESGARDRQIEMLVSPDEAPTSADSPQCRPVRLLHEPIVVTPEVRTDSLTGFVYRGRRFAVQDVKGPERIQTQWWHDVAVHRDYYRVKTVCGSRFWIYRDLRTGDWLMHGIFE